MYPPYHPTTLQPLSPSLCTLQVYPSHPLYVDASFAASGRLSGCASVLLHAVSSTLRSDSIAQNLQNKFIQTHKFRLTEDQVEILQRLRKPEALALI